MSGLSRRCKAFYYIQPNSLSLCSKQVIDREDPKTERWLSWNDFGPDKTLDTKTLQSVAKSLQNLEVIWILCHYLAEQSQPNNSF